MESNHIGFYSTEDGNQLSVNSLPYDLDLEVEVPFEIAGTETGAFTLNWEAINFDNSWTITLVDNVTELEIDLQEVNSYSFTVDEIIDDRFSVIATPFTSVGIEDEIDAPSEFTLGQNYPNPFNPTTNINYSVGEAGPVNITVYNVMGQKVAELLNTTKNAGSYQLTWNATGVASGIYYYRLTAPGQVLTRQMTLIK